jgi:hypothetical protein
MKRLYLLILVLIGLAAASGYCFGPSPRWAHYESPDDAQHSVYKVKASMEVDVTEVLADLGGSDTIRTLDWSGTGWVEQSSTKESFVVTAGHVCNTEKVYHYDEINFDTWTVKTIDLPIKSVSYSLEDQDGTEFKNAKVVLADDTKGVDLCMLSVAGDLGVPLSISGHDPRYTQQGWYIGAPHGIWGGGIAGVYQVTFMGRGTPWETEDGERLVFSSAIAAAGASGSPVMYEGEVVGVLVETSRKFETFMTAIPWNVLEKFTDKAHHRE